MSTDYERCYTAKIYLEKLSNGMDPFTGDDLPEDTMLNDVYLCRTFALAADIIDLFIKNGCKINSGSKAERQPFRITEAQKGNITLTEEEVSITTIANRINKVLDADVRKIQGFHIANWLEYEGLLTTELVAGKRNRVPTEEGKIVGITGNLINFQGREFIKNMYNVNAQAFIIANLDDIAAFTFKLPKEEKEEVIKEEPKKKPKTKAKKTSKKSNG